MRRLILIGLFTATIGGSPSSWGVDEKHPEVRASHSEEEKVSHAQEQEASSNVGPGKAVTAADPERGFKLSEAAVRRLGIKTQALRAGAMAIPQDSIVHSREETGVYRVRDGWFRLVDPRKPEALQPGDEIVVVGMGLVRVAELAAFESGDGHHGH